MEQSRRIVAVARRPFILVGLMLLAVGAPEVIIGYNKAQSYRASLRTLPPPARRVDPTQLYPTRSATDQQRAVVEAKVGYYELLHSAGRVLVLLGLASVLIGVVHEPRRPGGSPAAPESSR